MNFTGVGSLFGKWPKRPITILAGSDGIFLTGQIFNCPKKVRKVFFNGIQLRFEIDVDEYPDDLSNGVIFNEPGCSIKEMYERFEPFLRLHNIPKYSH